MKDLRQLLLPQASYSLGEKRTIDRDDLRHVGDRVLRQACRPARKKHVAWCASPDGVARQRHAYDGGNAAAIQRIALGDDDGSTKAWPRASGLRHVCPPDLPLCNLYHSTLANIRRAARDTKASARLSPS